jgi:hypothetical protein
VFFVLQVRFFKIFEQTDFHLHLAYLTGAPLSKFLFFYNLSWAVWFNAWFLLAQIIHLFVSEVTFITGLTQLINFNILLFVGFIVGNRISNSDLITLKSSILKFLSMSFLFGMSISITYMVLQISSFFNRSNFIPVLLLSVVIYTWHYLIKQHHSIKYISYYL